MDPRAPLIFVEVAFETLLTFVEIVENPNLKEFLTFCTDWFSDTFLLVVLNLSLILNLPSACYIFS